MVFTGDGEKPDGLLDYESLLAEVAPVHDVRRGNNDLGGLFYIGGTTGFPKGVMLSHANLMVSTLGAMVTGGMRTPQGRALHTAPMFHLADFKLWNAAPVAGNTNVLLVPTMIRPMVDEPVLVRWRPLPSPSEQGRHHLGGRCQCRSESRTLREVAA